MTDKEQIIIDGVDVSECNFLGGEGICNSDSYFCEGHTYCYFKQLQKEKFENLNNRQMVESAENLIYENSELYKNLKEKEQECDRYSEALKIIEEICLNDVHTFPDGTQLRYNSLDNILEVINNLKEEL